MGILNWRGCLVSVGRHVLKIIETQDQVWQTLPRETPGLLGDGPYLFVGSGTSLYLAQTAAWIARSRGLCVDALPAAEIVTDPAVLSPYRTIVVISRSGTTSEALIVADEAARRDLSLQAVSCHPHRPLAEKAVRAYIAQGGEDDTVVMIRSFTSMLLLLQQVVAATGGGSLPPPSLFAAHFPAVLSQTRPLLSAIQAGFPRRAYILGGASRYGIAQEGALKMQEMAGACALAFNPLEFRHGPWGSLSANDVVFFLGQSYAARYEGPLFHELAARAGRVVPIASAAWFAQTGASPDSGIVLPDVIPELYLGPLAIVPLQLGAWQWAVSRGENPDAPRNLNPVVVLEHE